MTTTEDRQETAELAKCTCDSGEYCHRHRRYGTVIESRHRSGGGIYMQPCGGGFRVVRKTRNHYDGD